MSYRNIPTAQIRANPDQPRKLFDEAGLRELGASIRENGLAQPITVRKLAEPEGEIRFEIVMGERRWRAHIVEGLPEIKAMVRVMDNKTRDELAIIENMQRQDVSPLEEARAFQRMIDVYGYSDEELARKLGIKQPWRIRERTQLLSLSDEYLALLKANQLSPSQAFEMSRLTTRGQDALFRSIKKGQCPTYNDLRAAADAILEAENQVEMFAAPASGPTETEMAAVKRFEHRVAAIAAMLSAGIKENEIVAVRKVDPSKAETLADMIAVMQTDMKRIETALRKAAVQQQFAGVA